MHGAVNLADYMPEPANGCGTLIRFGCFSLPTSCSCPVKHVQYRGRYLFGVERFRILLPNYWFSVSGSEVPHVRRDPYLTNNRMISRRSVFFSPSLESKGETPTVQTPESQRGCETWIISWSSDLPRGD